MAIFNSYVKLPEGTPSIFFPPAQLLFPLLQGAKAESPGIFIGFKGESLCNLATSTRNSCWLVVAANPSEKSWSSSVGVMTFPIYIYIYMYNYIYRKIKARFQTTNQVDLFQPLDFLDFSHLLLGRNQKKASAVIKRRSQWKVPELHGGL